VTETWDDASGTVSIDRRDFVKRTAIVGGMVWAAPIIQSIGSPAFAGTPAGTCKISNVAILTVNDGAGTYKFEASDPTGGPASGSTEDTKPCVDANETLRAEWCAADPGTAGGVTINVLDETLWEIVPTNLYGVKWAVVASGNQCYVTEFPNPTLNKGKTVTVTCRGEAWTPNTGAPVGCP
jgi:hypothetical protein